MAVKKQDYLENGVEILQKSIKVGDDITLNYTGLLASSGADMVYAHIGYGDDWTDKAFIPMEGGNGAFKATFKVTSEGVLNISFKDSAENWDNNSLNNYSFKVAGKDKAAKSSAEGTVKAVKATPAKKAEKKAEPKAAEEKKTAVKKTAAKKSSTETAEKKTAKKATSDTKKSTKK